MRNSIQLSIKTPCSEDFNQFKKTSKGGFCNSCTKEVVDFTGMSSEEIKHYFSTTKTNTCGRFNKSQLKTYKEPLAPIQQQKFNFFGALGLTAIALFFNTNTTAQNTNSIVQTEKSINNEKSNKTKSSFSIKGIIYNKTDNLPLPGASIALKNNIIGAETDFDGNFELKNIQIGDVLEIYYLGFVSKKITITNNQKLIIHLEEDGELLGDVIMMGEIDTREHYKTKRGFFKKLFSSNN